MADIAKVEILFKSPGPQPNDLQDAPDGLWYIDQVDDRVYRLDYETGRTLFEAQTTTKHSSGITFGGGFMWIASTYDVKIAKLDMQTAETIEEYESPGKGIVAFRDPAVDPRVTGAHGLEWRDGMLYVASPPSQHVHVVDAATWECVHEFRAPGLRVHGLAWADDSSLWIADTTAGTVSRVSTEDGRVLDAFRVEAPVEVHGLTIHEGALWFCDAHTRDIGRLIIWGQRPGAPRRFRLRIVVTGGSGRLGGYVIDELRTHGHDTLNADVIRPPAAASTGPVFPPFIRADAADFGDMVSVMAGADAVIYLATIPSPFAAPEYRVFSINVTSAWNVLQAAEIHGIGKIVMASSASASG